MLWTDIIDPATLTGYARIALAEYEASRGTLARWLPNREVADIVVRFMKGQTGLIDIAQFRAFDAEPELGVRQNVERVTIELPALGQQHLISEYEQLRARGGTISDEAALNAILSAARVAVRAVADSIERLRGIVLATGKATINQSRFQSDDDFGRSNGHTLTAGSLWSSATSVSRLTYLQTINDTYESTNGAPAGAMVMSRRVFRSLAQGDEMKTALIAGGSRPATEQDVRDTVAGAGFPEITIYDRRVSVNGVATRVIPDNVVLLLPAPVDTDDWEGTELGATFWGRTLSSTEPGWEIAESEQPGIVLGAFKQQQVPMVANVTSDAIALPVLANADLSLAATVLN